MTLHARVLLPYGLVAEIDVADEDRSPYVAPTVPQADHSKYCCCPDCLKRRTRETTT